MNYPMATPIQYKLPKQLSKLTCNTFMRFWWLPAKTVVQAYLQHIYAIFGGSLTLITEDGKEFKKKEFYQKAASKV